MLVTTIREMVTSLNHMILCNDLGIFLKNKMVTNAETLAKYLGAYVELL